MSFCPNCAEPTPVTAAGCAACGASFGEGSAWRPVHDHPKHAAEKELLAVGSKTQLTTQRLAFSPKVLVLFVVVGPLVALIGTGASSRDLAQHAFVLVPVYTIGSVLALLSWVIFSTFFALIHALEQKRKFKSLFYSEGLLLAFGALIGAVSGYLVFGGFVCTSAALTLGGWAPCLKIVAARDYGLSILPGLLCGAAGVLLQGRRGA